jgi:amidase
LRVSSSAPDVAPDGAYAALRLLAAGDLSTRQLVEGVLGRIEEADAAVNAVVHLNREGALAAAAEADDARRRGDTRRLLGLPVTVKDSIAVAGLPWRSGSLAREGMVADRDATVVARLRAAGAIVVAKTNTAEYTWSYETDNPAFGRTTNPRDPARTAGGSSGGEGALLGSGASLLGIGSDGFGSIRVPSHYCGAVGLRPTVGLVPETGVWPTTRDTGMLDMSCVGPMAQRVEDLELVLPLLAGADAVDPFVHTGPPPPEPPVDAAALRVGVHLEDGVARPSSGTTAVVERAAEALAGLGARVEEASLPPLDGVTELAFSMMAADGGARARADLAPARGRLTPQLARLLDDLAPAARSAAAFLDLVRRWSELRARIRAAVASFDVVLAPVAAGPAPLHGCTPGTDAPLEDFSAFSYVQTFSIAGLPVAVVPCGAERGLPIGVQVVAGASRDLVALSAAAALERAVGTGATGP